MISANDTMLVNETREGIIPKVKRWREIGMSGK